MRRMQKEKAVFFTTFVMIYISNISQVQAIDGKWGEWDWWSDCTKTCGDGFQVRQRECNNPPPQNGGKPCDTVLLPDCNGVQHCEMRSCNKGKCRVDGKWGEWDSWSYCTKTCGDGYQLRHRKCNNPAPQNGGKSCDTVLLPDCNGIQSCEMRPCRQKKCAVRVISGCKAAEDKGVEFCKFPFRYSGKTYEECTIDGADYNQEWCGIESNVVDRGDEWCYCEGSVGDCKRKNIAQGKKTSQSSTSRGAGSERAVDGDYNWDFEYRTCSHTQKQKSPWWVVDLGELFYVQRVTIYNRSRYQIRLTHLEVHVYHGDPTYDPDKPTKDNLKRKGKLCGVFHYGGIDILEVYCNYESRRVLLIIERETVPLTLCEVEVFGCKKRQGGLGPFSQWSACSATCGGGNKFRTRYCDTPPPKYGGVCTGVTVESKRCNEIDCLEKRDECTSGPCGNHGLCIDLYNEYTCECIDGYTGNNCQIDPDECDSAPCQNGGSCTDEINKYKCHCQDGFYGMNCETDGDDCEYQLCENGGACVDHPNSFSCNCVAGYTGVKCEKDVDDCEYQPCESGGTCVDHPNSFSCNCVAGYTGVKCETDINECKSEPCQNNGRCIDGINAFYCQCADGFTADKCEINIDECFSRPCLNNGTCIDRVSYYSCMCTAESSGYNCEFVSNGQGVRQEGIVIGRNALPPLIGMIFASVICVIILVAAIVKYNLRNSSKKEHHDRTKLTSVTSRSPRASRSATPQRQNPKSSKGAAPERQSPIARSPTSQIPRASKSATPQRQIPKSSNGAAPERQSPRARSPTFQSPIASSPTSHNPRSSSPTSQRPRASGAGKDCQKSI